MPRLMHGDETVAYRAVITTRDVGDHYEGGEHVHTSYVGPYGTVGAAKAAITRAQYSASRYWRGGRTVTGHVERSSTAWEKVE